MSTSRHRLPDSVVLQLELMLETDLEASDEDFIHAALDGQIPAPDVTKFFRRTGHNLIDLRGLPLSPRPGQPPREKSFRRLGMVAAGAASLLCILVFVLARDDSGDPLDGPITRAQYLIRLVEALRTSGTGPDGQPVRWPVNCSMTVFEDIAPEHRLAQDCRLAYALEQRILEGNREGETLDPDLPIMRIEASRLLVLAVSHVRQHFNRYYRRYEEDCRRYNTCESVESIVQREEYHDVKQPKSYASDGWFYYHIYAVTDLGIIKPRTSYRFDTTGWVNREEMELWICAAIPKAC